MRKQQTQLDALIQNAVTGYQINIMDLGRVRAEGEKAFKEGRDVTAAVRALLDQIAIKTGVL